MGVDDEFRDGVSATSRRALLTALVGLSAGCLRLSEDTQNTEGNETTQNGGSDDTTQDDGSGGGVDATENDDSDGDSTVDRVAVTGSVGQVGENSEEVVAVVLTVQRAAGATEIDLSEMSIQYVGDNGSETLVHASRDSPGFYLSVVAAEQEDDAIITADSDRYRVIVPFGSSDLASVFQADDPVDGTPVVENTQLPPLGEGEEAVLTLTTASGGQSEVALAVPDTLQGSAGDSVRL